MPINAIYEINISLPTSLFRGEYKVRCEMKKVSVIIILAVMVSLPAARSGFGLTQEEAIALIEPYQETIDSSMTETEDVNPDIMGLDSAQLEINRTAQVYAIFIDEGAGFHNTFGLYDTTNPSNRTEIWHDASAVYDSMGGYGTLERGEVADLGVFEAGSVLGFYLTADGARWGNKTYFTDASLNPDNQLQHVVTLANPDSPIFVIGFEDLWGGGDRDYNDLVVGIYVGEENVAVMAGVGVPEPGDFFLIPLLLGIFGVYLFRLRRERVVVIGGKQSNR